MLVIALADACTLEGLEDFARRGFNLIPDVAPALEESKPGRFRPSDSLLASLEASDYADVYALNRIPRTWDVAQVFIGGTWQNAVRPLRRLTDRPRSQQNP